MNEVVKYKNEFNGIFFGTVEVVRSGKKELLTWTGQELKTFFSLISIAREKGTEKIRISLKYLKELCGYEHLGYAQFAEHLRQLDEKKLALINCIRGDTRGNYERFVVFTDFEIDMDNKVLVIGIHEKASKMLNNIKNNFTRFYLQELVEIKNKQAILLYRELKQYRTTGMWDVKYETFKTLMGIQTDDNKKIREKVIIPAVEGLKKIYPDLKVERKYVWEGRSKKIDRLIFTFTAEKSQNFEDKEAESRYADYNLDKGNINGERWGELGEVYEPELPPFPQNPDDFRETEDTSDIMDDCPF